MPTESLRTSWTVAFCDEIYNSRPKPDLDPFSTTYEFFRLKDSHLIVSGFSVKKQYKFLRPDSAFESNHIFELWMMSFAWRFDRLGRIQSLGRQSSAEFVIHLIERLAMLQASLFVRRQPMRLSSQIFGSVLY